MTNPFWRKPSPNPEFSLEATALAFEQWLTGEAATLGPVNIERDPSFAVPAYVQWATHLAWMAFREGLAECLRIKLRS